MAFQIFYFLVISLPVIVFIKKLCFWVWLWQLKEYHSGRFLAHLDTYKGKRLILNVINGLKLICIYALTWPLPCDWLAFIFLVAFFVYVLELALTIRHILDRTLKTPVLTQKTVLILGAGFLVIISFFAGLIVYDLSWLQIFVAILAFDLLSPIIFSLIVYCFWPLTFIWQKRLIGKAIKKRKTFSSTAKKYEGSAEVFGVGGKDLIVVGITGSYGKTSTKEFLATILSEKFNILKTEKHQNSEVGISQCVLNDLKLEHEIFVCEMGAYNKGGIKLLCDIAQPKIGILTGINEQHLATFGSQENIIKTKLELVESLPQDGMVVLNWDNEFIKSQISNLKSQNYISNLKTIRCSAAGQVEDLKVLKEAISFNIEDINFNFNLVGEQNVINLLMAIQCAKELGMSLEEIAQACKKIKPFEKTMEIKKGINGVTIIDDSYAANPHGVFAALDYLKLYGGKKIIIMPCLIELGEAGKRIHQEIGQKIGQTCDLAIITTQDYFKEMKQGAVKAGAKPENILFLEDSKQIFEKIKPYLRPSSFAKLRPSPTVVGFGRRRSEDKENIILLESRVPEKLIDWLIKQKRL